MGEFRGCLTSLHGCQVVRLQVRLSLCKHTMEEEPCYMKATNIRRSVMEKRAPFGHVRDTRVRVTTYKGAVQSCGANMTSLRTSQPIKWKLPSAT